SDFEEVTEQELEFVETVSDTFHIPMDEYKRLLGFVLYPFDKIPNSSRILIIDDNKDFSHPKVKHLLKEGLVGQIRFFHLHLTNLYLYRYIGDTELSANGQIIHKDKVYIFNFGGSIRGPKIKTIYYSDIITVFSQDQITSKIVYEVKDLEYRFKSGKIGVHTMSFTETSGRLVGIMGASGAGKSTLLNVLNGANVPYAGNVLINGMSIFSEEEKKLEGLIGFVSQDDLLIEELTVFQNLYFNARLCFDNYTRFQLIRTVLKVLRTLGLYEIRDMKVGSPLNKKISGGQRKRLNIALELIREPAILFLDEPTSGLSSRDSENIMDLLKELTLKGKLIFVVIHQPSSNIYKMFDSMLILDNGGYLIYDGVPVDAITYFKSSMHQADWSESECPVCGNVNSEQIFNIIETKVLDEYGTQSMTRKISSEEWNKLYLENKETKQQKKEIDKQELVLPEIQFKTPNKLKQFWIFVKRDVLSKLANSQYLFINLLETPILALSLSFIIKYWDIDAVSSEGYNFSKNDNVPVYIFMAVIIAIFVGLTVSAEEIIKDRKILKREKFLNLSWGSYLFSKFYILLIISAFQALTFVLIGNSILEIRGLYLHYWIMLFSAWAFAIILGLNVSDSFKTAVTIYILIPFLVIPQMILSGIIVSYDKLNPLISTPSEVPWYGEIITARWAYEAMAVYQYKNNVFEEVFYPYDKIINNCNYKKDYWLVSLMNKVDGLKRNLDKPEKKEENRLALEMLRNEIMIEMKENPKFKFTHLKYLTPDKVTLKVIKETKLSLRKLKEYYIKKAKITSLKKDKITREMQDTEEKQKEFLEHKKIYTNDKLSDFVRNKNTIEGIVEYHNKLFRKIDPVYQDPKSKFIKAQFY
ncbi:MAG: ABC transporter, partial [Candidatus Zixiibacteriota bacterium]